MPNTPCLKASCSSSVHGPQNLILLCCEPPFLFVAVVMVCLLRMMQFKLLCMAFDLKGKNVHLSNTTILRDDDASSQKGQDSFYSPDLHTLSDRSMLWTKVKVILHMYLPSSSFVSLISFFTQANKAHPDMNHAALLYQHYSTSIYRATAFFEH